MKNCRDLAFSNSGLEVGLPAFQLPFFAKRSVRHVCFRNPFPLFFARTFNSLGVQRAGKVELLSRESQSSSNNVKVDV